MITVSNTHFRDIPFSGITVLYTGSSNNKSVHLFKYTHAGSQLYPDVDTDRGMALRKRFIGRGGGANRKQAGREVW